MLANETRVNTKVLGQVVGDLGISSEYERFRTADGGEETSSGVGQRAHAFLLRGVGIFCGKLQLGLPRCLLCCCVAGGCLALWCARDACGCVHVAETVDMASD